VRGGSRRSGFWAASTLARRFVGECRRDDRKRSFTRLLSIDNNLLVYAGSSLRNSGIFIFQYSIATNVEGKVAYPP
jgi:hypothetical protein